MSLYKTVKQCRICNSKNLVKYLDLGKTPLANSLIDTKNKSKKELKFPLRVLYCKDCSLSQLSIVVNPKVLFSQYVYRSSISKTFEKHCKEMAEKLVRMIKNYKNDLVVDIASNDGCLLRQFKDKGFRVVGVEPARNIANIANSNGIETLCTFWNHDVSKKIMEKYGQVKVITATNVLAHVDDLNEFLKAGNSLLEKDGLFVVEVPYLYDLLMKNEFDTVYHEHLSYFLVKSLKKLYEANGLNIFRIEEYPIHGGSLRIYASKNTLKIDKSVNDLLEFENNEKLYDAKTYKSFENKVKNIKKDLVNLLKKLKKNQKKIVAYGASAKGNTLLNYCGIDKNLISFVVDDTPEKQNKFAPGSKIPIKSSDYLDTEKPDYIVLLAWNFAKELMSKTKEHKLRGGKYIIPIPKVIII